MERILQEKPKTLFQQPFLRIMVFAFISIIAIGLLVTILMDVSQSKLAPTNIRIGPVLMFGAFFFILIIFIVAIFEGFRGGIFPKCGGIIGLGKYVPPVSPKKVAPRLYHEIVLFSLLIFLIGFILSLMWT